MSGYRTHDGFTLVELAVVVTLVLILALMIAPFFGAFADVDKSVTEADEVARIYRAIVGTPETGSYGYLGDVGDYPTTLLDLIRNPGLTGWSGPYLTDVYTENDTVLDKFGAPFDYYYSNSGVATEKLAVISKGPDRGSSNLSTTPNDWTTYTGNPLPSVFAYATNGDNADNIVYPQFTHHTGLLDFVSTGQLNLNVFNYDTATSVSAYVPGCPNLYEIKATSVKRSTDTWGDDTTDNTTPTYAAGGASFDLMQGTYKVQLRLRLPPHGVYWEEQVDIAPGGSQTRTVYVPNAVDSSATPTNTLTVVNNLGYQITVNDASGAAVATIANGMTGTPSVKGCARVTIRNDSATSKSIVDAFTMPVGIAYTKRYGTGPFSYTITNSSGTYRYLFVYLNGNLIGEVSGWGKKKSKTFSNLQSSDVLTVEDESGTIPTGGTITVVSTNSKSF